MPFGVSPLIRGLVLRFDRRPRRPEPSQMTFFGGGSRDGGFRGPLAISSVDPGVSYGADDEVFRDARHRQGRRDG